MQDMLLSRDDILELLRENGYRLTGPRRTIVEAILAFGRAFSADDLVQRVDRVDDSIGRATVFRSLDVLTQLGALDRLHAIDGCHSYIVGRGQDRHYHHLICSSCGVVIPFDNCNVEAIYDGLTATTQFQISGHMLEIFGLCSACQN